MRFIIIIVLIQLFLPFSTCVPVKPAQRYRLKSPSVRAFTADEFYATYELMVQYKYGNVSNCPVLWKYKGIPLAEGDDLFLRHEDMQIASRFSDNLVNCSDDGVLHLQRSTKLNNNDSVVQKLRSEIANDVDKTTVFNSIFAKLIGHLFYVSSGTKGTVCGTDKWFRRDEMFIFFDESDDIALSVVAKIMNGGPRILSLPLMGNVRYMLSVRAGTTCIYRVESDVLQLLNLNNTSRPSDSPFPTPQSPSPSPSAFPQMPFPGAPPSPVPSVPVVPALIVLTSATPSPSPHETPSNVSPSANPSTTTLPEEAINTIVPSETQSAGNPPTQSTTQSTSPSPFETSPQNPSPSATPLTASHIPLPPVVSPPVYTAAPMVSDLEQEIPGVSEEVEPTADMIDEWAEASEDPYYSDASPQAQSMEKGPKDSGGGACFPASSHVTLENGKHIPIPRLKIGQRVAVGNGDFSKVIMFTHRDANTFAEFITLRTNTSQVLTATGGHYVYANTRLALMRDIVIGDFITQANGRQHFVTSIDRLWKRGLFNAHTESGEIVVDGMRASCYTESVWAFSAHSLLAPVRAVARCLPPGVLDVLGDRIGSFRQILT